MKFEGQRIDQIIINEEVKDFDEDEMIYNRGEADFFEERTYVKKNDWGRPVLVKDYGMGAVHYPLVMNGESPEDVQKEWNRKHAEKKIRRLKDQIERTKKRISEQRDSIEHKRREIERYEKTIETGVLPEVEF